MTPASPLTLVPPAARQGPGPMPPEVVEALSVHLTRRVSRSMPGDQRAAGVGARSEEHTSELQSQR